MREQRALLGAEDEIVEGAQQDRQELPPREFLPQSIPFYAATEAFNYFRQQYPDYAYKEAALNSTNPRDRTSDWEMDVAEMSRNDPAKREFDGRRDAPGGQELFISAPIRVDDTSCLICHGAAASAPPELLKLYGMNNDFGWKLNDVVGAQMSVFRRRLRRTASWRRKMQSRSGRPPFSPPFGLSSTAWSRSLQKWVDLIL